VKHWSPATVARAAGGRLITAGERTQGPERSVIDSRQATAGALFVGLPGQRADGGQFAHAAIEQGAWGVIAASAHLEPLAGASPRAALIAAEDPLAALQRLATAWRRELGVPTIGVTGSTGKTSTKDILLAVLAPHRRTVASRANFNTEIGVPLEILSAPAGTEVLVLEMAMRGRGQIAELARIAEPDVGIIVNIGPVHLELLGSIEAIAATKAELVAGLPPGGTAIVPAGERLLDPHLRDDVDTVRFGPEGDVRYRDAEGEHVVIDWRGEAIALEVPFDEPHLRGNLLAAVAAARAVGVHPSGRVELAASPGRGDRIALRDGATLYDDSYNANPVSMRAALDSLARRTGGRRIAVLGDMLELGPDEVAFHRDLGAYADSRGVDVLVTVGPLAAVMRETFGRESHAVTDAHAAAELVERLLGPGDHILVKASRGVGLELVCRALTGATLTRPVGAM
jgi:UDP-N-acetylmuramoyl-tripeptide--D-alanyl-D-alanine ligase